jgi:hypothetical protein
MSKNVGTGFINSLPILQLCRLIWLSRQLLPSPLSICNTGDTSGVHKGFMEFRGAMEMGINFASKFAKKYKAAIFAALALACLPAINSHAQEASSGTSIKHGYWYGKKPYNDRSPREKDITLSEVNGMRKIDINPTKENDGIKTGCVIAYGPYIAPPYKITRNGERIVVNGVQVYPSIIVERIREAENERAKKIVVTKEEEASYNAMMDFLDKADYYYAANYDSEPIEQLHSDISNMILTSSGAFSNPRWNGAIFRADPKLLHIFKKPSPELKAIAHKSFSGWQAWHKEEHEKTVANITRHAKDIQSEEDSLYQLDTRCYNDAIDGMKKNTGCMIFVTDEGWGFRSVDIRKIVSIMTTPDLTEDQYADKLFESHIGISAMDASDIAANFKLSEWPGTAK